MLGHETRTPDYKYWEADPCNGHIHNHNTNSFRLRPPTVEVGVIVDLDETFNESSCIS